MSIKFLNKELSIVPDLLQHELQNILVIQTEDASAIVMLSPALRTLRDVFPRATITLMTSESGSQVTPLLPWLDHVMIDPVRRYVGGSGVINPRAETAFLEHLRADDFSIALLFTSFSQSSMSAAYACYLAGIPYRIGFAREANDRMLSHGLFLPVEDIHQVDRNLRLLEAVGIYGSDQRTELSIPEYIEHSACEQMHRVGLDPDLPYLVLAPGSRSSLGHYGPEQFAAAAHILSAQTDLQLVVVGSSAEAQSIQPVLELAHENLYGNIYSLVDRISLPELAAVIRHASLTIANRSISMHFADVFECPLVVLYPETETVSQWAPRNAAARLLSRPASCSPCGRAECPYGINCRNIRPEEVAIAALELLSEQPYSQTDYKGILGYTFETEQQEQSSTR